MFVQLLLFFSSWSSEYSQACLSTPNPELQDTASKLNWGWAGRDISGWGDHWHFPAERPQLGRAEQNSKCCCHGHLRNRSVFPSVTCYLNFAASLCSWPSCWKPGVAWWARSAASGQRGFCWSVDALGTAARNDAEMKWSQRGGITRYWIADASWAGTVGLFPPGFGTGVWRNCFPRFRWKTGWYWGFCCLCRFKPQQWQIYSPQVPRRMTLFLDKSAREKKIARVCPIHLSLRRKVHPIT